MFSGTRIINPLNAELNPTCHLLALLGGATIVVVSRLRVKHGRTEVPSVIVTFLQPFILKTRKIKYIARLCQQVT
jgi:hypothetical protein